MAFCKFSTEYVRSSHIEVDNEFVSELLPAAPDFCVKVYLYGLYLCGNNGSFSIEDMSIALNAPVSDIESAFIYWQELGALQILSSNDFEVRYLPTKFASHAYKKYNSSKFQAFNLEVQEILSGRQITPNEFNEYYYLIGSKGLSETALVLIIKYCANLKGNKVNYPYISTVVRDFISNGLLDEKSVEDRLHDQEASTLEMQKLFKVLKLKRAITPDDYNMYLDWTKKFDLSLDTILSIADHVKTGGMNRLNALVLKCYEARCENANDVEAYFDSSEKYYDIAKSVCKHMGLYYDNLENIVDKYVTDWTRKGYDKDTLVELADYCFLRSIRTLDRLDALVEKFYQMGRIDIGSIHEYIEELKEIDNKIKNILESLGSSRNVTQDDRDKYSLWQKWNISDELLSFAIEKSAGKSNPMIYLHKVLSSLHSSNITSVDEAKKMNFDSNNTKSHDTMKKRNYKKEDISSLFDDIRTVEL